MVHFECRRDGLAQAHPLPTLCLTRPLWESLFLLRKIELRTRR